MEFALGIIVGILVGAAAEALTTLWLSAHRGRVAAHVLSAELAGHRVALDRWLDEQDCRVIAETDPRYRRTFAEVASQVGKPVPALPSSAWTELRGQVVETAPDDLLIPLVGWYEPIGDRELLGASQMGTAAVQGFGGAAAAVERLADRSRLVGFWFVLRGPPKGREGA